MKNTKKALLLCLCIIAVAAISVMGTLAWLADKDSAVNTFTVGQVDITVDEAKVTPDGQPDGTERVKENNYHLIPGQTYTKDPTLTVEAGSEASYVRMLVTLNCKTALDTVFAPGVELTAIFNGWDGTKWVHTGETQDTAADTVTYEFRYCETVDPEEEDVVLDALFESFTIPGTLDGEDLKALQGLTITVDGHAIQAAGFATADEAWTAFTQQYNP